MHESLRWHSDYLSWKHYFLIAIAPCCCVEKYLRQENHLWGGILASKGRPSVWKVSYLKWVVWTGAYFHQSRLSTWVLSWAFKQSRITIDTNYQVSWMHAYGVPVHFSYIFSGSRQCHCRWIALLDKLKNYISSGNALNKKPYHKSENAHLKFLLFSRLVYDLPSIVVETAWLTSIDWWMNSISRCGAMQIARATKRAKDLEAVMSGGQIRQDFIDRTGSPPPSVRCAQQGCFVPLPVNSWNAWTSQTSGTACTEHRKGNEFMECLASCQDWAVPSKSLPRDSTFWFHEKPVSP